MRIPSGVTDQYIYFVALDSTDYVSRETGLSSFTVYRSRNGGAAAAFTSPTINETDSSNMPGVYELLLDEDMTIGSGNDSEEMAFHITHAGMAPVTRTIELYRPKVTAGETLTVSSGAVGSVSGAVGSVTGNVGGNVTGSVGSVLGGIDTSGGTITTLDALDTAQDTQHAATQATLNGVVLAQGTIGSTGNDTTHLHLTGLPYGDDELNDYLLVIYDDSAGEYHSRWITDWVDSTDLATVATLPFTPEDATDTYWLLPTRQDVTGGGGLDAAGVRAAIGMASADLDTQLGAIVADTGEIGSAGAGLTAIPWNSSWDTEVQSECNDAIVANGLDHLVAASVTGSDITDDSIVAQLVSSSGTADWDDYDNTTDSLQNIRDEVVVVDGVADAILVDTAVIGALGAGLTAIIGADGDTLKTLSDQIDGLSTAAAPQLLQNTTIATLASQTSFTLTAGSADDDAYNGGIAVVTDQSTSTQKAVASISDYTGSSKTVTLSADPGIFTMAVGDTIDILAAIGSAPTAAAIRTEIDNNSTQLAAIVADTNELQADWTDGGRLDLIVDAILVDTGVIGSPAGASVSADIAAVKTDTAATLVDTNELQADWVDGGRLDLIVDAILVDTATIGTPAGASVSADIAAVKVDTAATLVDTNELQTDWTNGGRLDLLLDATLADTNELQTDWADGGRLDLIVDATLADSNELQTDWANGGRLDLILDATATASALSTVSTNVDAILVDTGTTLPATLAALNDISVSDILTTQMTESYASNGTAPTLAQALFAIHQMYFSMTISGTTMTIRELDNTTTAFAVTLDDGTSPTTTSRA